MIIMIKMVRMALNGNSLVITLLLRRCSHRSNIFLDMT